MRSLKVYFNGLSTWCRTRYPRCYGVLWPADPRAYLILRGVLFYFGGSLLGALFWKYVLYNVGLPFAEHFVVGLGITALLGFGCAFSTQIRCYCSLCLVAFLGKAGRGMLKAVIFSCVLTGPINNICLNAGEVVRVFTCSAVLTYNLSVVRLDLMTKPFQAALCSSKENLQAMKEEFRALVNITEPIRLEVEGLDETEGRRKREEQSGGEYREGYERKLEARCRAQLERGVRRCKKALDDVHQKCHQKLPMLVNYMLCWPLKIDVICSVSRLFGDKEDICSPEGILDSTFGNDYEELKIAEQSIVGDLDDVRITYEIRDVRQRKGYLQAKNASMEVTEQFNQKKKSFDYTMFMLEKMFAFVFLKVIVSAMSYHQKYLKKMDFQNHYIGEYFNRIDLRRKKAGKVGVLPLRYIEKPYFVDLDSVNCSSLEFKSIFSYSLTLIFLVLAVAFFMLLDNIFYQTLNIVAKNSEVRFDQQGYHDINVTVTGTGVIANLVRRTLEGISSQGRLKLVTSNEECLPKPTKLATWAVVRIYVLIVAIVVLSFNEAIVSRLRRLLCAWFYPKREKQRILYLYNQLLRRRKGYFKFMLARMLETSRRNKYSAKLDFLNRLVFYYPRSCHWIKLFHRKSCSICNFKFPLRFEDCSSYDCFLTFCDECWKDLEEKCPVCAENLPSAHEYCAPDQWAVKY